MKTLTLAFCAAGMLVLAGCGGSSSGGGNGNANNGTVKNLQQFAINNCNKAPSGDPANINAGAFNDTSSTDPATNVYSRNCLQ